MFKQLDVDVIVNYLVDHFARHKINNIFIIFVLVSSIQWV